MAIYDRSDSGNLPVVRQTTQMQNREIGEIIIKSFETVTEALSDDDVPVNPKQIEDAIVKGINRSNIGKGMASSGSTSSDGIDYYQKLQQAKYEDYLKNKEKREQEESIRESNERQRKWNENVDKTFAEMNKWSQNPLKGASDLIDKGLKTLLGVRDPKDPSTQAIVENNTTVGDLVRNSIIEVGSSVMAIGKFMEEWKSQQDGYEQERRIDMDALIQETTENKEENEEQNKEEKKSRLLNIAKIGLIVGAVTTIAGTLPLLISGVADFFARAPVQLDSINATIKGVLSGPNSVGKQIEMGIRSALGIGALSKEEKGELKQLQKFKDKESNDKWFAKQSKALFAADRPEALRGQIIRNLQNEGYDEQYLKSDEDLFNVMTQFIEDGGTLTGKYLDYYNYLGSQFYNESMESRLQELESKRKFDTNSLKKQQEEYVQSQLKSTLESKGVTKYQADYAKDAYGVQVGQQFIKLPPTAIEKVATRDDEYRGSLGTMGQVFSFYITGERSTSPYAN